MAAPRPCRPRSVGDHELPAQALRSRHQEATGDPVLDAIPADRPADVEIADEPVPLEVEDQRRVRVVRALDRDAASVEAVPSLPLITLYPRWNASPTVWRAAHATGRAVRERGPAALPRAGPASGAAARVGRYQPQDQHGPADPSGPAPACPPHPRSVQRAHRTLAIGGAQGRSTARGGTGSAPGSPAAWTAAVDTTPTPA